jgi:hypothetical protein
MRLGCGLFLLPSSLRPVANAQRVTLTSDHRRGHVCLLSCMACLHAAVRCVGQMCTVVCPIQCFVTAARQVPNFVQGRILLSCRSERCFHGWPKFLCVNEYLKLVLQWLPGPATGQGLEFLRSNLAHLVAVRSAKAAVGVQ